MTTNKIIAIQDDPDYAGTKVDFLTQFLLRKSFITFGNVLVETSPVDDYTTLQIINRYATKEGFFKFNNFTLSLNDAITYVRQQCYVIIILVNKIIKHEGLDIKVEDEPEVKTPTTKLNNAEETLMKQIDDLDLTIDSNEK